MALPLDVLLSHAVLDVTRAAERLDPTVNVVAWSDFLRVADGADRRTIHLDARIASRCTKSYVERGQTAGIVTVDDGVVRLTGPGLARRDAAGSAVEAACDAFEARHGAALRAALVPVVAALELELPHYIHPYGAPDPSITGGRPRGAHWKPVRRDRSADTTSHLSILALLSQALTAYSIEYEQRAGPMVWGVFLARHPDRPLPYGGTFERHRFPAAKTRDAYAPVTAAIEATWREQHGDVLRAALEALDGVHDAGHVDHPHVALKVASGFAEISGEAGRAAR